MTPEHNGGAPGPQRNPRGRGRHVHGRSHGLNGYDLDRDDLRTARVVVIALGALALPGAALVAFGLWTWSNGWPW